MASQINSCPQTLFGTVTHHRSLKHQAINESKECPTSCLRVLIPQSLKETGKLLSIPPIHRPHQLGNLRIAPPLT